ncbi:UNVERIFIED_CONTAM: hypothetical protein HDU68_006874 [Siphonaria sp. JEL0065]|nr:hypothetical protein HDU68_006874 [Siphonaria sp. JEL0065]
MATFTDPYEVLGITRSASEDEVKLKDPTMRQRFETFGMEGVRNDDSGCGRGDRSSYGGFTQRAFFHDPRSIFE